MRERSLMSGMIRNEKAWCMTIITSSLFIECAAFDLQI